MNFHYSNKLFDRQGNPLNEDGSLKFDIINDIDELTDEDFTNPTRSVCITNIGKHITDAIGAIGKPVIIKRNIFLKNKTGHAELTPAQGRKILSDALYHPSLFGQTQKTRKPYNWVLINTKNKNKNENNRIVLIEVNLKKDNVEVVHWHFIDDRGLERLKRQAEREDGQLLILPSENPEEVGALSDPTFSPSFKGKDSVSESE
ncbi:MAG: hypothetical protein J6Y77_05430 [Paludibacteraceae bacterium]|nr:hypothetical protein [Paludibacteraceae bacterium]